MSAEKSFHWAWIILGVSFFDLFINYSIRLGYGVVLPEMIEDLGLTRAAAGSIYNAYLFCYLCLAPFTGYLTDRFGARRIITLCLLILACGVLLMGTARRLSTMCLFFALVGVGAAGMWAPVITMVQRWFSPRKRGLALGIISPGYGLGFAAIGLAFPSIVHHFSWRHAWYFLGIGALIMVLVNAVLLKSDPESAGYRPWGEKADRNPGAGRQAVTAPAKVPFSLVLKSPAFWTIGLSYFSVAYALYTITTFMVDYAKTQVGMSMESASLLATVHGIAQVVGVLAILPLSDYLGRKKTLLLSNAVITACLAAILLLGAYPAPLFAVIAVLAVFYGVTFPIYGACAGDYFPKAVMGTVIGAWTPCYGLGAMLSHWVTGYLRDVTGVYDHAFVIGAIMALLSVVLVVFLKKDSVTAGSPS
jgi:sugar phosphate permease